MKKLLLLSLVALFGASLVRAEPTRAQLLDRVTSCEAILRELIDSPTERPNPEVWKRAKAVLILNQFKAGLFIGVQDGYGVILVKRPDGQWSIPVLINAGEASLGFQLGAKSVTSVFIITDDQIPRALFKNRFNIGVDAKAVAGPKAAEAERVNHELLTAPLIGYVKSKGLYAGATIKAGHISRNDPANFALYNTQYTLPELLYSDWVQPIDEVKYLMGTVIKLTK